MTGIFISYRRSASKHLARLIFSALRARGYDVFLDVTTIDSGEFDRIILNQIAARPHFLLVLSPGALERCANEGDWLRREMDEAFRLKRNIVPVYDESFDLDQEKQYLPEPLRTELPRLNAPPYSHYYFDSFIDTLSARFLKPPEYEVAITPTPEPQRAEVERRIEEAASITVEPVSEPAVKGKRIRYLRLAEPRRIIVAATISLIGILAVALIYASVSQVPSATSNAQWTPRIQTFNGVEMVLVPAGCFMMGSNSGAEDEQPIHQQCFNEPFWIDRFEVTNAQYGSSGHSSGNNRPREEVTWFEARAHCVQRGARLPNEAEWEYAARGPDDLEYPWGNEFVADNVIYDGNSGGETAEVGQEYRPEGKSWVGAYDMSGNVWEWVSSAYERYPYDPTDGREDLERADVVRVLRGGSFFSFGGDDMRAAVRNEDSPDFVGFYFGFRCARSQ